MKFSFIAMPTLAHNAKFANGFFKFKFAAVSAYNKKPYLALFCIFSVFFVFFALFTKIVFISIFWLFSSLILLNTAYKSFLFLASFLIYNRRKVPAYKGSDLPVYSILLPVLKENPATLKSLISALSEIKYPKEKLDIQILLEESDSFTNVGLDGVYLPAHFRITRVPSFSPQTKPKACNFGLYRAKGEYLVIYDAEDKPDPEQILKALTVFKARKDVSCVQCRLNFYNRFTNPLSWFFGLEYMMWFNYYLPAINKLTGLIPLGGTSNHFRIRDLFNLGGWDSYNVTEDAEIGVRLAKAGLKCEVIDSYTWEECPVDVRAFVKQRVRWLKGFLQTFITHMADAESRRELSFGHICSLVLNVGLGFFNFFLIPVYAVLAFVMDVPMANVAGFVLLGVFQVIFLLMIFGNLGILLPKVFRVCYPLSGCGGWFFPVLSLGVSVYFCLHIIAGYIAFFEFFIKPHHWHKTVHKGGP